MMNSVLRTEDIPPENILLIETNLNFQEEEIDVISQCIVEAIKESNT